MYIAMYISGMVRRYSIADARAHLSAIVEAVESGSDVQITRRGEPVAVVVSQEEYSRLRGRSSDFAVSWRRFVAENPVEEAGMTPEFVESLRDRSTGRKVDL